MNLDTVMVLGGSFNGRDEFKNYLKALKAVAKLNPEMTLKSFDIKNTTIKEIAKIIEEE